jgi:hypothetical protein
MKYLQSGVHYYNKNNLRSTTLRGYATAINTLFELQKYRSPIDFNKDDNNMAGVIISNIIKEGNIAK